MKQHIIPQVYLREFGYIDTNNQWRISTVDLSTKELIHKYSKPVFCQKSIESITTEKDIFDVPFLLSKRGFEELNGKIETEYPKLISELGNSSELSPEGTTILIHIVSNLLCRTVHYRELVRLYLNSHNKPYFIKAIWKPLEGTADPFISTLEKFPDEEQLNMICLIIMNNILYKLSTFRYRILKDFDNRGWITCDNPVVLENAVSQNSIFSINTGIYFPLSKDFCAYLYHRNATIQDSPLRDMGDEVFINTTEETQEMIYERIRQNAVRYIFFPGQINDYPPPSTSTLSPQSPPSQPVRSGLSSV
jgi:Protein of unknown function (DUF4238)